MVIANNALWKGARGSLDGLVFQSVGDKVIVRTKAEYKKVPVEKQSRRQQQTRRNFKDAAAYAVSVTRWNPEKKAYYAKKAKIIGVRSAYSAAISDYMRGLTIESVDTSRYNGKVGGKVKVTVRKKDFAAKEVNVTLKTGAGEVIERGKATVDSNGAWVYRNMVATIDRISNSRFQISDSRLERMVVIEIEAVNWDGRVERKTNTVFLD
jgi:hypothetical protein